VKYRADIDGLRAIAILLVVIYHAGFAFSGGFVGVDVFFVVSGFLITRQLVDEATATGRIDVARFWARRARRLLPAVTTMMLVVAVASTVLLSPFDLVDVGAHLMAAAVYGANVIFARQSVNYFAADIGSSPLLHLWSLSLEEQFYVGWPIFVLLVVGVARKRGIGVHRAVLVGSAVVIVASFALDVWFVIRGSPWAFFGAPLRAWQLAVGAALAAAPGLEGRAPRGVVWCGVAMVVAAALGLDGGVPYPGVAAVVPTLGTAMVLCGTNVAGVLNTLLTSRVMTGIGRLSYSWYLWHWPFLVLFRARVIDPTPAATVVVVTASLVVAWASYTVVESRLRHHPWLASSSRRSLSFGLVMILVVVGSGLGVSRIGQSRQSSPGFKPLADAVADVVPVPARCEVLPEALIAPECQWGQRDAPGLRILLLGDSHARQWIPALDEVGKKHRASVTFSGMSSCPAVPVRVQNKFKRSRPRCDQWQQAVRAGVDGFDVVVLASASSYVENALLDQAGGRVEPGRGQGMWREAAEAVLKGFGAARTVIILDNPRHRFDGPRCLATLGATTCVTPLHDAVAPTLAAREAEQAAARAVGAAVFDPVGLLCGEDCPAGRNGVPLFRDAHHLTSAAVLGATQRLETALGLGAPQRGLKP
jgi:peptidoglycan/LPS O-acetylase OafA/YrhL